jgi:hypothetical protein
MMTHKDYELIAKVFAYEADLIRTAGRPLDMVTLHRLALHLASRLRDDNDRFDNDKFLDACHIPPRLVD